MIRLVYCGGKFRDPSPWNVYQHMLEAERAAAEVLRCRTLMPITPHVLTRNLDSLQTDGYWLEATLELMTRCDAVYVVPNWGSSVGTLGEILRALELGKPVFFSERSLRLYGALCVDKGREDWIDLSPILKQNVRYLPAEMLSHRGSESFFATFSDLTIRSTTMTFALEWKGDQYQDFGTPEWAIETISCLRSNGILRRPPQQLAAWITDRIEAIEALKVSVVMTKEVVR